jgi:hypothetical protein
VEGIARACRTLLTTLMTVNVKTTEHDLIHRAALFWENESSLGFAAGHPRDF